MGRLHTLTALCVAALVLAAASCNSAGCTDNGSAIPLAGFYSSATGEAISIDSIDIFGVGAPADSALLRSNAGVGKVYLPMHASATQTAWRIVYRQKALAEYDLYDVLTIDYEPIPYFASHECGAMYIYRVRSLTCTDNLIDSVTLTDSLITNIDIENLQIYFRTAAGEGDGQ